MWRWAVAGVAALLGASAGCRSTPADLSALVEPAARQDVFLRASIDDDPRHLIGRFVSSAQAGEAVDEGRAVKTACSAFIVSKSVMASQRVVQTLRVSSEARTRFGAATLEGPVVLVDYRVTRKLVSDVADPAAFAACCRSAAHACSKRYLGEFIAGSGSIYVRTSSAVEANAEGLVLAAGQTWSKAITFEDSFFAFRTYDAVLDDEAWIVKPPSKPGGQYFVGVSPLLLTEDQARDAAMRHARVQAVNYLGTVVATSSRSRASALEGYLAEERIVQTSASALVELIKDERYKLERVETTTGWRWRAHVLAWFPHRARAEALHRVVEAIVSTRGDALDRKTRDELDALVEAVEARP